MNNRTDRIVSDELEQGVRIGQEPSPENRMLKTGVERREMSELHYVNHPVAKVDSDALVTGRAVYTNDLAPADCLIVKLVRSPYAHALIKEIDTSKAEAVSGGEIVMTDKDWPDKRL